MTGLWKSTRKIKNVPPVLVIISLLLIGGCAHIENGHERTCERLAKLSKELDSLLADPLEDEEYRKARLTLSGGIEAKEGEGFDLTGHNSAKIPLPALEDRWGVIIGAGSDSDDEDDVLSNEDIESPFRNNYESFLRFFNKANLGAKWHFDVGVRYSGEFRYFFRFKGKRKGWIKCSQYRLIPRIYWRSHQGFGSRARFELDQRVAEHILFREFLDVKYTEISQGVDIYSGVYLRAKARENIAMSLEMTHYATTHPWKYQHMEILYRFRKNIHWKWLEFELEPKVRLQRKNHVWKVVTYIEAVLHLTFDAAHLKSEKQ